MSDEEQASGTNADEALSAAQRARIERNRQRARALRDARLVRPPLTDGARMHGDCGGGFLPDEAAAAPAPRARAPPAPVADPAERPRCLDCERTFPQSYLFDTFGYHVCDECRDEAGAHALLTRTEAKSAFLLQDCDLDLRPPPLRCVRRRNPHARRGDMRLYVRAQLQARALQVWGSAAALEPERARGRRRGRGACARCAWTCARACSTARAASTSTRSVPSSTTLRPTSTLARAPAATSRPTRKCRAMA